MGRRENQKRGGALGDGILLAHSGDLNQDMPRSSSEAPINQLKTTVTEQCFAKTVRFCFSLRAPAVMRVPLLVSECLNLSFLMWNVESFFPNVEVDGKILPFNLLSLTPIKAQGQRHPPKSIWFDFKVRKFSWNCVFVRFFSDLDPAEKLKELKSDAAARFRFLNNNKKGPVSPSTYFLKERVGGWQPRRIAN